ncbi:MAG: Flp pilus assembly protein CpaB [Alicyclobacillus sp.]|nr:Flp pilus assembly protein CpaB [Alicyclobacillus sp.]
MARRTQWLLLAVAILLGWLASVLIVASLKHAEQRDRQPTAPVVFVAKRLAGHQLIDASDVTVKAMPRDAVPPGAMSSVSQVVGRLTAGDWFAGEPVLSSMLVTSASQAGFSLAIPAGERAFTLPDDPVSGVDHLISPGDHVDVVVTYTDATSKQLRVVTVLQDVLVLYVDETPQPAETTAAAESTGGANGSTGAAVGNPGTRTQPTDTITLALTPEQVQTLAYAHGAGEIQLVLRNPADTNTETLAPLQHMPQ